MAGERTDMRARVAGAERRQGDDAADSTSRHRGNDVPDGVRADELAASPRPPAERADDGVVAGHGLRDRARVAAVAAEDREARLRRDRRSVARERRDSMARSERLRDQMPTGAAGRAEDDDPHSRPPLTAFASDEDVIRR